MNTLHNLKFVISNFWWTKCYLLPPFKISNDCVSASEHSVHWGINPPPSPPSPPPQKHHPSSFRILRPPKSANCPSLPFSGNYPIYIGFSWPSPPPLPKTWIFRWTPKILKFFISFTPTYLLKVSKVLVKITQFEFLVVTEQSNLVYKLFCPDFSLFFI